MSNDQKESKYLQYLPAIYQSGFQETHPEFLGQFLKAFERILSGIPAEGETQVGLETILDQLANYFDPYKTPARFLPWLASWVALTLKEEEEWYGSTDMVEKNQLGDQTVPLAVKRETRNRNLISRIVPLYQKRGTKEGLEEYLKIYVGDQVHITINEFPEHFQVGVNSRVGVHTMVGEAPPYYFLIQMVLPVPNRQVLEQKRKALIEIIDREKPAHTYYTLSIEIPTMQIGEYSTVGSDTVLGGMV